MLEKIKQTADYLRGRAGELPKIGIILGTGLGTLVDHIENAIWADAASWPCRDASTTTKATT